jgi:signal transduction histidine kinase
MGFIGGNLSTANSIDLKGDQEESGRENLRIEKKDQERFRDLYQLQKISGENFVHNSMSPLSTISGYLELMDLGFEAGLSTDKLQGYREKIEKGVNELGFILEQMQELFGRNDSTLMDLNADWIIEDIKSKLHNSARFQGQVLSIVGQDRGVYVTADPFQMRMCIYNLLMVSARFADQNEPIEISAKHRNSLGEICIRFRSESLNNNTVQYFQNLIDQKGNETDLKRSDELKISISSKYAREMNGDIQLIKRGELSYEFRIKLDTPV